MELSTKDKRLFVMSQIKHPETYYKKAMKSLGFNLKELTHGEISQFKASMLVVEADAMIYAAENYEKSNCEQSIDELLAKQSSKK